MVYIQDEDYHLYNRGGGFVRPVWEVNGQGDTGMACTRKRRTIGTWRSSNETAKRNAAAAEAKKRKADKSGRGGLVLTSPKNEKEREEKIGIVQNRATPIECK